MASVAIAAFGFISGAFDLFTNSRELFDKLTKKETSATQATEISTISTTTTAPPAAEIITDIPEPETTVPVIEIVTEPPTTEIITEPETIPASVPLSSLEAFNGGWEWNNEAPVDPWGNDYSDACNYHINSQKYEEFSEYYTGGEYKRLTFNLAPHTNINQDDEAYVQVYKDEELIYTSPTVFRKTQAFSCDVDISGAEYIEIYLIDSEHYWGRFIFSDAQLWTE